MSVKVAPQPGSGRTYGAAHVKGINLSNAGTGDLKGLKISQSLGALSGVNVDEVSGAIDVGLNVTNAFNAGAVSGAITIGNSLFSGSFSATTLSAALTIEGSVFEDATITIGTASAPIVIRNNLDGNLTTGTLADLTLQDPFHEMGGHSGNIHITNNYSGTMVIYFLFAGSISLDGDLTGTIGGTSLGSPLLSGNVFVSGDINSGRISFDEVIAAEAPSESQPCIHVHGSITGSRGEPLIAVDTLTTTIAVDGKLLNANTNGPKSSSAAMGLETTTAAR